MKKLTLEDYEKYNSAMVEHLNNEAKKIGYGRESLIMSFITSTLYTSICFMLETIGPSIGLYHLRNNLVEFVKKIDECFDKNELPENFPELLEETERSKEKILNS